MAASPSVSDDKYKIFDTSEFQARQALGGRICVDADGIVVFQRRFGYRVALAMLGTCLCVLLLAIFLFLFAASSSRAGRLSSQVAAFRVAKQQTCESESCLTHAAYMTRIMNATADPCEDFYDYACGNYEKVLPYTHWLSYTHVFKEMNDEAMEKVELAVTKPITADSPEWERKVKDYYSTCTNYYRTHLHDENPLVSRVFNKTPGLSDFLFGRGVNDVNIDEIFRTVSGKYYVHSLLGVSSMWNDFLHKRNDRKRYSIWVGRKTSSIGILKFGMYFSQHHDVYLGFIKDIANLLIRDSRMQVSNRDQIVNTFANDVLEVENKLFTMHTSSHYQEWQNWQSNPPHHPDRMMEVRELNRRFPHIDFKAYLGEVYGQYTVTDSTKVVLYTPHYLDLLNQYFNDNNATTSVEFKRKMSNYLTWVITMFFEWDLSPEYRQKFLALRQSSWYANAPEEDAHSFCFSTAEWGMEKALSALYVREYLNDASKDKANRMFEQLQTAAKAQIDKLNWMDASTKSKAKAKVDSIIEKSGYPEEAKDNNYMNQEYTLINTHYADYFQLLISTLEYKKGVQRKLLNNYNALDFEHWGKLWNTHYSYHAYDNEILIQAGILQTPLFSTALPQQLVYGGFGSLIGHEIVQSYGIIGQLYDRAKGYKKTGWWSDASLSAYKQRATCVRDSLRTMLEAFEGDKLSHLEDEDREKKVASLLKDTVNWTVREMGGLKVARDAFDLHKLDGGYPLKLPVFDKPEEQMFYIAYAQLNCHHQSELRNWINWIRDFYPWKVAINTVVANTPGFAKTFNCPAGSRLNVESRLQCSVF